MNDDKLIRPHAMIDKKGIASDRKDAHIGPACFTPETWISGQQLGRRTYLTNDRSRAAYAVP